MASPSWQTIEPEIAQELTQILGSSQPVALEPLQAKDGVYVCRASQTDRSVIVKFFADIPSRREISNYQLLISLGVPTLQVLGCTKRCLCLEDLSRSERLRLGTEDDMSNPIAARLLASWYRELHARGAGHERLSELYSEPDLITADALIALTVRFPQTAPTCDYILNNMDTLLAHIAAMDSTLTYNDFYWTNLAVRRDSSSALMFDYNLLGRGYRYGDVRNVCSSLSPTAGAAFIQAYGPIDPRETTIDAIVAPLVGLISAAARPSFPSWAENALRSACDGRLLRAAQRSL